MMEDLEEIQVQPIGQTLLFPIKYEEKDLRVMIQAIKESLILSMKIQ
jgi:hypothetical protein